ncbi:MAG: ABC transporter ATP-binding protein, partial [Anaerolineaceae bacterium]|nr:ABC transporter ATP-binding protein [Anaerolineaceae bacterium]
WAMNDTLRWLYQVPGRKRGYIPLLTLLQALLGGFGVLYALLLRNIVDAAANRNMDLFRHDVLLIIGLVLVQTGISALVRRINELAKADIENIFKQRLFQNILRREYSAVSAVHTAEWLNRLTNDSAVTAGGYAEILPGLAGMAVRLISALVMIIALDRWFAWLMIPGGILMMLLTYGFRKVLKRLHKDIQESDGRLRIFLQEHIGSLMMIKSFAAEEQSFRGASEAMERHKVARMRRNSFSNFANIGFTAAMQGMYLTGIIYCAYGILNGNVTYGTLTAVMHLIGQIQRPFAGISGYLPRFYAMTASAERLMEIESYAGEVPVRDAAEVRQFYRGSFSAVGLRDADFSYLPDEGSPAVLRNLSLEIRKGETVAFTGYSGCGKSTILKLLMSMYPLDAGERYLSSQQGEIPLDASWRRLFAYVPQGNALMNGTIREVVSFSEPEAAYDETRLRQALTLACADEFVTDVDMPLGERGSGLSEGQMQRLAVARALFSGAPILLLDESTSALDEQTERRLLQNLQSLTDRTVIIVTHRRSVLDICDRVIETENREEGTHGKS